MMKGSSLVDIVVECPDTYHGHGAALEALRNLGNGYPDFLQAVTAPRPNRTSEMNVRRSDFIRVPYCHLVCWDKIELSAASAINGLGIAGVLHHGLEFPRLNGAVALSDNGGMPYSLEKDSRSVDGNGVRSRLPHYFSLLLGNYSPRPNGPTLGIGLVG